MFRYCRRFGFVKGIELYTRIKTGHTANICIPDLKHPITLRHGSSDTDVFFQIYMSREYDPVGDLVQNKNASAPVIIDGGANIGLFTVRMKSFFPDARVICIEPDVDNFETLRRNVAPYADVTCEHSGIWHSNKRLKVYDKNNSGKWGLIVEEDEENGNVDAVSIGDLMEKHNIDRVNILKLDIEGSEREVFSSNFDKWLPRIDMLVVELHDRNNEGCTHAFFSAVNHCYASYRMSISGETLILSNITNR
jgi:FkbM family methyltransferase